MAEFEPGGTPKDKTDIGPPSPMQRSSRPENTRQVKDRKKDYWLRPDEELEEKVEELYPKVVQAFQNKDEQVKNIRRYWGMFNCILDFSDCQQYHGDNTMYVPAVRDGVNGLVRRMTNMLLPESGHYTECIAEDGQKPQAKMALLDHYVERSNLAEILATMGRNGYVEGQFNLYVDWEKSTYSHTKKIPFSQSVNLDSGEDSLEVEITSEDETDVLDVSETLSIPSVSVLSTEDLAVVPETSDTTDEAIDAGGFVAIALRVTEGWVERQKKAKSISKEAADDLIERIKNGSATKGATESRRNADKAAAESAGIKVDGTFKFALVYQVWTLLELPDSEDGPELCVIHYAGPDLVLAVKRCPFWIEKVPVLSVPDQKVKGSFFGSSRLDSVEQLQYGINDAMNMGMDSAQYSLMPIFAVDPDAAPQYNSMVINMAALWKVPPDKLKNIEFPQLYKMALEISASLEMRLNQSLGLTSATIPAKGKKPTQAEVAQEQTVQILNTTDEVVRIERCILNPLLERFAEYDQQFRDEKISIEVLGELGMSVKMEDIPPNQFMDRYVFKWRGTQAFTSMQRLQQKMAGLNVLQKIPPQMLKGKVLDLSPVIEEFVQETYGARTARQVLKDMEDEYSIPPDIENQMLARTLPVGVRPTDDDQKHIQEHMKLLENPKLPYPAKMRVEMHIHLHQAQMQQKAQAEMAKQAQALQGPGQNNPGPRAGAVPGSPRPQGPAGMIHPDQMRDPSQMPRKM